MRNALTVVLLVCIAILGVLLYSQTAALRKQRRQVQELNAKLETTSKTASLDLQKECAKQAREEFLNLGWGKHESAVFANHYNQKLNKCFIQILDTDAKTIRGTIITSKTVFDAFEGKIYANYVWSTRKNKKYWEVPPLECKVTTLSGEERSCHSSDEFDALVKQYME